MVKSPVLKIYTDGGARGNPGPSAAAFVVIEGGKVMHKGTEFLGKKTNNEAEYAGVIIALKWLLQKKDEYKKREILFCLDSELVTRQLVGQYKVKSKNLQPLITEVKKLERELGARVNYTYVPREKNRLADSLLNETIDEHTKD